MLTRLLTHWAEEMMKGVVAMRKIELEINEKKPVGGE